MYDKEYWYKNRDKINARRRKRWIERKQEGWKDNRLRKNKNNRDYTNRSRLKVFELLNQKECQRCHESDLIVLQLDHINGGGTKDRHARTGVKFYLYYIKNPDLIQKTFQMLCANCHIKKHKSTTEAVSIVRENRIYRHGP